MFAKLLANFDLLCIFATNA